MEEEIYKLESCANKLGLNKKRYTDYLKLIGEDPIIYPNDKTERVTESMHTAVFNYITKKQQPIDEVNEEKDFKSVANQITDVLKKDYRISKNRIGSEFFKEAKTLEWESIVNEVNHHLKVIYWIDKNVQKEYFYMGMYKFGSFKFDQSHKIPILKIKPHKKYGRELYLEFPILQETIKDGIKGLKKIRHRITGDLNSITNSDTLYSYANRLILSVYFKIKAGYVIKYTPAHYSVNVNEIEGLPINNLPFIPTLYAYLEHFKSVNSIKIGLYSTIKSDVNTLTKFMYGLPRKLNFDLDKLEHTFKFNQFNRRSALKFKEYLQKNTDTRSGTPICNTTIGNIFSSLANLTNRIIEQRQDLENQGYVNPFLNHRIERSNPETHIIYDKSQLSNLSKKLKEKEEYSLLFFIEFLCHTGIRPIEARKLRIGHFKDISKGLFLPGNITKNGKSRKVPIIEFIKNKLQKLNIVDFPADYYLFSSNNCSIGQKMTGKNYFSRKFKKIRNSLSDLSPLHTLYSFRHTFAKNYMQKVLLDHKHEFRTRKLGQILGHSSSDMTEKYLRTIGEDFTQENPNEGIEHWEEIEKV